MLKLAVHCSFDAYWQKSGAGVGQRAPEDLMCTDCWPTTIFWQMHEVHSRFTLQPKECFITTSDHNVPVSPQWQHLVGAVKLVDGTSSIITDPVRRRRRPDSE